MLFLVAEPQREVTHTFGRFSLAHILRPYVTVIFQQRTLREIPIFPVASREGSYESQPGVVKADNLEKETEKRYASPPRDYLNSIT